MTRQLMLLIRLLLVVGGKSGHDLGAVLHAEGCQGIAPGRQAQSGPDPVSLAQLDTLQLLPGTQSPHCVAL